MSRILLTRCITLAAIVIGGADFSPAGVSAEKEGPAGQDSSRSKLDRDGEVHLVHGSHHDLGYTDLPSNVLSEHDAHMDRILEFCAQTADWPEDSKFRYAVEQAWSVLHYLKSCSPDKRERLIQFMREGRIEVTATLGNQITGLCSDRIAAR
jgi:hypothetical protein